MTKVDRWLLPEGIEDVLPDDAYAIEKLRRSLLDFYHLWGYDLVIPPLVEFTDSLLSGSGRDLDLLTFKITDQLSGKLMGVRADITPQTARMDAHSLRRKGPNRLCYASTVLYTRPRAPLASRSPIQAGVELYGEPGLEADLEVISLLSESVDSLGIGGQCLDLGHVGLYRSIEESLDMDVARKAELFALLQSKSCELATWVESNVTDRAQAELLRQLPRLAGDSGVLERARSLLTGAPTGVSAALDELTLVVERVSAAYPGVRIYIDLCELESYHYHTGIVFAVYADGARQALGNGGRYDGIGASFGRPRPATGFTIDLKVVADLLKQGRGAEGGVYAPASDDPQQWQHLRQLRRQGERVVCGFHGQRPDFAELGCDRILEADNGRFTVKPV